jgi:hypothetical protein
MTGAAITKQRAAIRTARERIMMVDGFLCAEMQQEGKCASTECFGRKNDWTEISAGLSVYSVIHDEYNNSK